MLKSKLYLLMLLILNLTIICDLTSQTANKTATKFSAGLGMGIPATMFSINSKPVGMYIAQFRYNFNENFAFEARATSNIFFNNRTGNVYTPGAKMSPGFAASDIISYRTAMMGIHGIGYYFLTNALGLNKNKNNNWAPFASFGGGLHLYKPGVSLIDGTVSTPTKFAEKPARDYQLGIGSKYYVNHNLDLNIGLEYHYLESYYLDGAGFDRKLDDFVNFYVGAFWKIGSKPWKNAVEWNYKNIEEFNDKSSTYSNWSADLNIGLPYIRNAVGYSLTGMGGIGIRHSFSKSFALGGYFNYGNFAGSQSTSAAGAPYSSPQFVKSFSTKFTQFTVRSFFNLRNIRTTPENRRLWNHYFVFGAGIASINQDAEFSDGSKFSGKLGKSINTYVLGYQARKYINNKIDWTSGLDYGQNESKYLDAAPNKSYINASLYFYTGVSVKIGNKYSKENIDWMYKGYVENLERKVPLIAVPLASKDAPKPDTARAVAKSVVTPEPKKEEPKIEQPKVIPPVVTPEPKKEEPKIEQPKVIPPVITETVKEAPKEDVKPAVKPVVPAKENIAVKVEQPVAADKKEQPKANPKPITDNNKNNEVNSNEVIPPDYVYNVIVACYSANNVNYAIRFKNSLEKRGYAPKLFRDNTTSQLIRVSILSTDDKQSALSTARKARREIDKFSWIHLYNKQ